MFFVAKCYGRRCWTIVRQTFGTDLMALDRSPELFAHQFYVLVLFFLF